MKKYFPLLIILGCTALFVLGVLQLFNLRFDVGDVYSPYSSLRSDPLGTMAFYESIAQLPGVSTRRDFSAENRLPEEESVTYLHLAASAEDWEWMPEETFREVESFIKRGGRLVITMYPQSSDYYASHFRDETETNSEPAKIKNPKDEKKETAPIKPKKKKRPFNEDEDLDYKTESIEDRWGVSFGMLDLKQNKNDVYEPVRVVNRADLPLPLSLEWHSGIILTNLDKAWQTIYARGNKAVVVERKFGRGSVVIATDSYFVSNEAMLKDCHADFLAWLIGASKSVVFDEAHFGVVETSGVAGLMRKYRLYWLAGGLILLAGLFIWKNSAGLVPSHSEEKHTPYVAGKEASAGFVNLLRRNISPRNLLDTCFEEWKKSVASTGKYSATRLQHAEAIFQMERSLPGSDRNPLRAYQEISTALANPTRNTEHENHK